jgi:hypothetical protein
MSCTGEQAQATPDAIARHALQSGYLVVKLSNGAVIACRLGVPMPLAHMFVALGDHDRSMMPADLPGPPHAAAEASAIAGDSDAQRLLLALRDGGAPADLLLEVLHQVQTANDAERLRSFMRRVQKALEGQA